MTGGADAGTPLHQPLVWVDLEMTGLDPDRDVIVEVAVVVTDGSLDRVLEGPDLVVAAPAEALAAMRPVVAQMHAASGLTEAVRASQLSPADAEAQVLDFVRRHVPDARTAPLAGNSVHADRAFLRRHMSAFEAHLHYRNVDVSTVKELVRRWYPDAFAAAPRKAGGHRALADILESIAELRHWRETVFRPGAGQT
ncbi:MAG: oligoribonuclease [Actinomycetota bacterium]|nr:oligoribonuclease [Actinomycetota bacterium]